MPRRRDAVQPLRHAAGGGDLGADLGPGQHAAVAGLGALRELELDHLHLRVARVGGETFLAEAAVLLAAAEVARADFPDQVAAVLAVVGRDRALACVVVEVAALRSEEHTSELPSLMRISYAVF